MHLPLFVCCGVLHSEPQSPPDGDPLIGLLALIGLGFAVYLLLL